MDIKILPSRQAGFPVTVCSAASFSLRGCRVPSKALFTAKQLTLFGSFPNCSFKASRRKKKRKKKKVILVCYAERAARIFPPAENFCFGQISRVFAYGLCEGCNSVKNGVLDASVAARIAENGSNQILLRFL